ncbi:hypothetical protein B5S28_g2703 [[Candida] boidinii]|nr:hypothetical protein B5S28_g2703 [[Candida] boidinii]OWB62714.1 hypothetical protein B5S29_g3655 [[Candida] boidinii]
MWEDFFSVQIFFIILRETLESAIIVSVLLSFVKQSFDNDENDKFNIPVINNNNNNNSNYSLNSTDLRDQDQEQQIIENSSNLNPLAYTPLPKNSQKDEKLYRHLRLQIWVGAFLGLFICLCLGAVFIAIFYIIGNDIWSVAERIWEGIFSILSAIIISIMGLALLRINQLQTKWKWKLSSSLNENNANTINKNDSIDEELHDLNFTSDGNLDSSEIAMHDQFNDELIEDVQEVKKTRSRYRDFTKKYALGILPFVTTLREGLEAVVFVGGIGVNQPMTSFPLAIICGGSLGALIGITLYKGGNKMSLQYFLIFSTCFLYMVAAGLFSRGVWFLELEQFVQRCGQDTSETGSGPGSYDIANSIWHVNCCNGLTDGGWMLLNALVGWTNSATYGSILSYIIFWLSIILFLNSKTNTEKLGYNNYLPIEWQFKKIRKQIAMKKVLINDLLIEKKSFSHYINFNTDDDSSLLNTTHNQQSSNDIINDNQDTTIKKPSSNNENTSLIR